MKYDYKDDFIKGFYTWNKPTVCLKKDDERYLKYKKLKKEQGFTPDECWDLYSSICIFLIPRLKYFKKSTCGHPCCVKSFEKWQEILGKMIWSFEEIQKDNVPEKLSNIKNENKRKIAIDNYYKKIQEGLHLFADYFWNLWW